MLFDAAAAARRAARGGRAAVAYVADGEENKNAAGLGIKKIRVLRRRGTGPVRVLFFDDAESGRRLRINRHVELCR